MSFSATFIHVLKNIFAYIKKKQYLCSVFWRNMYQLLIVIVLLIVAVGLLSVGVIMRKDHSFRSQHIHENPRMKRDGIKCATAQDRELRRTKPCKINVKKL